MNPTEEQLRNRLIGAGLDPTKPGGVITPISLESSEPIQPVQPAQTSTFPVSSLSADMPKVELGPQQTDLQKRIEDITKLNLDLAGEEQFRAQKEQEAGIETIKKTQTDF